MDWVKDFYKIIIKEIKIKLMIGINNLGEDEKTNR